MGRHRYDDVKGAMQLLLEIRMRCQETRPYRCGSFNIGLLEVSIGREKATNQELTIQKFSRESTHINANKI